MVYDFRFSGSSINSVPHPGWVTEGGSHHFIVNKDLQLDRKGRPVEFEAWRYVLISSPMNKVTAPLPSLTPSIITEGGVAQLMKFLEDRLPQALYLTVCYSIGMYSLQHTHMTPLCLFMSIRNRPFLWGPM